MYEAAGHTLRLAHRGDARVAPENTVAALVAALEVPGCDGNEFDVRTSRDGRSILLHDETLQRVHHRAERPAELTMRQLQDAGVSTLEDALDGIGRDAFLDIEVKEGPADDFVDVVDRARGPQLERAVISSFSDAVLRRVRAQRAGWRLWLNAHFLNDGSVRLAQELGCGGISAEWHCIDEGSMRVAREAGLDVAAWTVTRRTTFDRLSRLGVIAVCVEAGALGERPRAVRS